MKDPWIEWAEEERRKKRKKKKDGSRQKPLISSRGFYNLSTKFKYNVGNLI